MGAKIWKGLAVALLLYTFTGGLFLEVPRLPILNETIRNLYFHVPMWFGMLFILTASVIYSVRYLRGSRVADDLWAAETANVGLVFGVLGIVTGMWWAKFTWGDYWSGDPKQNASAVALLIYFGYSLLRGSLPDPEKRARVSAIYNIFAFAAYIPLLFILPRLTDSLHPGNGGNPGFNAYDLDSKLRWVFYPAVLGWTLLGFWFVQLRVRMRSAKETLQELLYDYNA